MSDLRILNQTLIRFPESFVLSAASAGSIFSENYRFAFSDLDMVVIKGKCIVICEVKKIVHEKIKVKNTQFDIMTLFNSQLLHNAIFFVGLDELKMLREDDYIYVVNFADIVNNTISLKQTRFGKEISREDMQKISVASFRNYVEKCLI